MPPANDANDVSQGRQVAGAPVSPSDPTVSGSYRAQAAAIAAAWLGKEPAVTVLLFVIVGLVAYGAFRGVPAGLTQIQNGYERIAKSLSDDVDRVVNANDQTTKSTNALAEEIRRSHTTLADEIRRLNQGR